MFAVCSCTAKHIYSTPKVFCPFQSVSQADKSAHLILPPVQPPAIFSGRGLVLTGHYLSQCGSSAAADGP